MFSRIREHLGTGGKCLLTGPSKEPSRDPRGSWADAGPIGHK
jgi:hypothetical protein